MGGFMITDRQYQQLLWGQNKGWTLKKNAIKAGACENTARKYIKNRQQPSEAQKPHSWRTRPDPFEKVWESEVLPLLRRDSNLEGVTILELLECQYPDQIWERHLRTLQRRIQQWRWKEGPQKEVYFPQDRIPGSAVQLDWTRLKKLQITINSEPFTDLLCHIVFPFSNWQWGKLCTSESLVSLKVALQSSLLKMGGSPSELWTDNSSSATHQVRRGFQKRSFNQSYQEVCSHWGLEPRAIQIRKPNQNGDVESSNGHLKRRIEQALLLRGHRDFDSKEAVELFIHQIMDRSNQLIEDKRQEELKTMRPLPASLLPEYSLSECTVSRFSTVMIHRVSYSVPNRLIGASLRLHIYEDHVEGFFAEQKVLHATKSRKAQIQYAHVIDALIKKPGAFQNYRWRDQFFPHDIFKVVYQSMQRQQSEAFATREHLQLLKLCVERGESTIANTLEDLIQDPKILWSSDRVKERLGDYLDLAKRVQLERELVPDLSSYDQLFRDSEDL
jgi:molybdopterin-biosynthesis enzyme MoeA-like protein